MTNKSPSVRRTALLASTVAVLGVLTACGSGDDTASSPSTLPGTAAPATDGTTTGSDSASPTTAPSGSATDSDTGSATPSGAVSASGSAGTRCHTFQLSATVGRNNPGAGQENFPIVLTNKASHTCTVRGYPGAAFTDASGKQLGPDPKRSSGTPETVSLDPGQSAWAGLTFSNPEVSGAHAATPTTLLVTPPDERDSLKVKWTGGQVPVSGNSSSVFLTVFSPGTGA
ncbi:DUF4232 domain-containing protein [Streptomyces sp. NPDC047081]|uniref:DUF4232 domain-containing protein n=1 Tax=Streptomyces sp. NPDC047081 TaxID=3154706 RepID=UPI0034090463